MKIGTLSLVQWLYLLLRCDWHKLEVCDYSAPCWIIVCWFKKRSILDNCGVCIVFSVLCPRNVMHASKYVSRSWTRWLCTTRPCWTWTQSHRRVLRSWPSCCSSPPSPLSPLQICCCFTANMRYQAVLPEPGRSNGWQILTPGWLNSDVIVNLLPEFQDPKINC